MASKLGRVSRILGLVEKSYNLLKIANSDVSTKDKWIAGADYIVETVFVSAGASTGGAIGIILGSSAGPIGSGVGFLTGGIAGGELMGRAYDKVKEFLKSFGRK